MNKDNKGPTSRKYTEKGNKDYKKTGQATIFWQFVGLKTGLFRACFDTADKMLAFLLIEIKIAVVLIVSIHNPCLAGIENFTDKRPLVSFAVCQISFAGN